MIKLPATIISLVTKHNFQAERVDYAIEIGLLGSKFTVPVSEAFVERLDNAVEPESPRGAPVHREEFTEDIPSGYGLGVLEKSADEYTDEEIERL